MEPLVFGTLASRLPRIGGMATMPSRRASLMQALPHILRQVDRLYLYLDQHTEVPAELAGVPKLVPLLPPPGERHLRGAGKLMGLHQGEGPCLFFGFDDDIIYGDGYVEHLACKLRFHGYRSLVGLHGAVLRRPITTYTRSREVSHFAAALDFDLHVDELGTGTIALHSACLRVDPRRWLHTGMSDLMVGLEAIRQGVPRVAVTRPAGLATAIAERQPDSLHMATVRDDQVQTELLLQAMEAYPDAWCRSA
jgi:hypothetical protein